MHQFFKFLYSLKFPLFKRLIPSLVKRFFFLSKNQIIKLSFGKIKIDLTQAIDREIYLNGFYEKEQLIFLDKICYKRNITHFFDIGANIGYYSIYFKNIKNILSFEPNKYNFFKLKENKELNHLDIKIYNFGLSSSNSEAEIWYTDKKKMGGSAVFDKDDPELKKYDNKNIFKEMIYTKRLDDITKSGQWTSHSDKLFDPSELKNDNFNFDEWFDSLNDDQQMQYSQMIGEANEIIATLVWEKLRAIDKEEIFMNDYSKYEKWFDTLDPENIDFYMERLINGKRLIPKFKPWSPNINTLKAFGVVPNSELDYEFVQNMFNSALLENLNDGMVRCTTVDGMLIICSLNKSRLDYLKEKIVNKSNVGNCEYRKKVNQAGNLVHTYIFEMPNK